MKIIEPIGALTRRTLDRTIEKIAKPRRFLTRLLFPASTHKILPTEHVQWDTITEGLQMAPFVAVGGQPVTLKRGSQSAQLVMTPNIAVNLPLTAQALMLDRMAGETVVFANTPAEARLRQYLNKTAMEDLVRLEASVANREEWMIGMALRGTIEYTSVTDGKDNFTISMNKPNGNTLTPTNKWDNADVAVATKSVMDVLRAAKKLVIENQGPVPTMAICGADAADAIETLIDKDGFKRLIDTNLNWKTGTTFDLTAVLDDSTGVQYIGTINNVKFYRYISNLGGDQLIRDKYVEFLSPAGVEERRMYYGMINDLYAIKTGSHMARRYTQTRLQEEYPSFMDQVLVSRPLPVLRRPDWYVSAQVLA